MIMMTKNKTLFYFFPGGNKNFNHNMCLWGYITYIREMWWNEVEYPQKLCLTVSLCTLFFLFHINWSQMIMWRDIVLILIWVLKWVSDIIYIRHWHPPKTPPTLKLNTHWLGKFEMKCYCSYIHLTELMYAGAKPSQANMRRIMWFRFVGSQIQLNQRVVENFN